MKTPQRNFVVEFKSRRQPKARTNSIWGDTDFKALAREIDDQHFEANEARASRDAVGLSSTTLVSAASETAVEAGTGQLANLSNEVSKIEVSPEIRADHPNIEVPAATETLLTPRPRKRSPRAKSINRRNVSVTQNPDDQITRARTPVQPVSGDEIATLDAENKRLKQLLADHLRTQNLRLKQMLGRFDLSYEA